jgi:hypothetical protein
MLPEVSNAMSLMKIEIRNTGAVLFPSPSNDASRLPSVR